MPLQSRIPFFATALHPISSGFFQGRTIRHTVRERGTQDWLLIYTLAGSGLYRFKNGGHYVSKPHDISLFAPESFHDYRWAPEAGRWDLLYAHFLPREEWLPWLNWPQQGGDLMLLHLKEPGMRRQVIRRLRDMVRLSRGALRRGESFGMNALEEVLLWCDSAHAPEKAIRNDPRVLRVMEALCQDPAQPFSEERLASLAGISSSRLRHLFVEQVGKSMRLFQEEQRLEQARQLLAFSSWTISEIADKLGFSNPFYFSLRFKKFTGEAPRHFRQRLLRQGC